MNYDDKYANLIIKKCFVNDGKKPLVIVYDSKEFQHFVDMLYKKAKENGFKEVYIFNRRSDEITKYMRETKVEDIKLNDLLDRTLLEETAKKEANYLYVETMSKDNRNDIDKEKIKKIDQIINSQLETFYDNTGILKCPWCYICYPTSEWAKKVYPDMNEEKAYEKLYMNIMKMCLIDRENPEQELDNIHKKYKEISTKLNELKIRKLHYTNSLGTNLDILLPDNHIWLGADDKDYYGNSIIVNYPAYELFTSPIYNGTNGIVYSSMPLNYKKIINNFGLEFKNGKVTRIITSNNDDYEILNQLIETDEGSKYLGECALVENDTPVCQTKTLYYELLYDENASPHLALGNSYQDSIEGGLQMDDEEIKKYGLNISDVHVDFMVGTNDLKIEADTIKGKKLIYSNGKILV